MKRRVYVFEEEGACHMRRRKCSQRCASRHMRRIHVICGGCMPYEEEDASIRGGGSAHNDLSHVTTG